MERRTRVRFAPSPTGPLHMGGVRTALYNYLYAKQHGGDFILRIEDTDSNRFVPGAEQYIIEALNWCGIVPDEGVDEGGKVVETASARHPHAPYRQSQRRPIYRKYAEQLVEAGWAYYAFDSAEELDACRKAAEAAGQTFTYNAVTREKMRNSLTLPADEVERLLAETDHWTVRFKMPAGRIVEMDDLIRGHISVNTDTLDDKVLWKRADELPTYHLANIVDDHLMEISHVIRGEEWLPSAPLHVLLYKAFGWEDTMPQFAHLPLLLKPDGKGKLSKRDGDRLGFPVFPLEWHDPKTGEVSRGYREDGYFPEAVINFLALLGWNPGTEQELFTLDELVPLFDITKCSKAGAKFAYDKGIWFNHEYILKKSAEEIAGLFFPIVKEHCPGETLERVTAVTAMMKDRVSFVKELWPLCSFFFEAPTTYDEKTAKKRWKEDSAQQLTELIGVLEGIDDFSLENQEQIVHAWIEQKEYKLGNIMNAWRLTLVGEGKGPGMFDISAFLGKEETIRRMKRAIDVLG